jgi:tRNA-2-methylthio-N6-dimethylallyladenosine synthase
MSSLFTIESKVHDESRQGEAYSPIIESQANFKKLFYVESYGCAMNFADSEVVASILAKDGFQTTNNFEEADVILLNTCSIRENAEIRVRKRLHDFKKQKKLATED